MWKKTKKQELIFNKKQNMIQSVMFNQLGPVFDCEFKLKIKLISS